MPVTTEMQCYPVLVTEMITEMWCDTASHVCVCLQKAQIGAPMCPSKVGRLGESICMLSVQAFDSMSKVHTPDNLVLQLVCMLPMQAFDSRFEQHKQQHW